VVQTVIWNLILEEKFGLKLDKVIQANNLLEALDKVSVPEGYFFREKEELVKFLRENFLGYGYIRVLSVGCGRGEEVYTIAYLCRSMNIKCDVVGLDISMKNLMVARSGIYTSFSLRGMKENFLMKWGTLWRVPSDLQRNSHFVLGNLMRLPFKDESFDAVICRNVLIYISPRRLNDALNEMRRVGKKLHLGIFDSLLLKGVLKI